MHGQLPKYLLQNVSFLTEVWLKVNRFTSGRQAADPWLLCRVQHDMATRKAPKRTSSKRKKRFVGKPINNNQQMCADYYFKKSAAVKQISDVIKTVCILNNVFPEIKATIKLLLGFFTY